MPKPNLPIDPDSSLFAQRIDELRGMLTSSEPDLLAARTGTRYESQGPGDGAFHIPIWERAYRLSFPDFVLKEQVSGLPAPLAIQALTLYYFTTADGSPVVGNWISFSDLPSGRFYDKAFQSYTGQKLQRAFNEDKDRFCQAALKAGGVQQIQGGSSIGDTAFTFQALPRIPLLVSLWQGDEDFPSSFRILFDASASHYLPTDVCAIVASMLAGKILASARRDESSR